MHKSMLSLSKNTPPIFRWIFVSSVLAAMIPTFLTSIDLGMANLFTVASPTIASASWWWVEWINVNIPSAFRWALGFAFVGWLFATLGTRWKHWRMPLAFFVAAGIFGPGLVVNAVFKDNWQRARPYQVENFGGSQQFTRAAVITDQCHNNCAFVSGHVACGFFLSTLMLVSRRRRLAWAVCGTLTGLVIGFARMSNMDHWLSDVLWAYPITLASSWIVWKGLLLAYPDVTQGEESHSAQVLPS
jgi:lipid A 4'-phosphatase